MSFDYKLLGKKLKEARESLAMSAAEVAEQVGMSKENLLGLENNGFPVIDGDKLVLLSKVYLRDFRYFVTGDYKSAESQITAMFRQNNNLSKGDRIAIQQFIRLCEYKNYFEELIQREKPAPPDYAARNLRTKNHKDQGKVAAAKERERLNLIGPIENPWRVLRSQKIHVFRRILQDKNISGVYIRHPVAGHCILINYNDDLYRQNFSVSHEYCHVIFDADQEQNISYQEQPSNPLEWRANSFAASFLVPEQELKRWIKPSGYEGYIELIPKMCHHFNVSGVVLCIRLYDIGWINDKLKETLLKDKRLRLSKKMKTDPELDGISMGTIKRLMPIIQGGLSIEYIELCRHVYQDGLISYGKMMEALMLPFELGKEIADMNSVFMELEE